MNSKIVSSDRMSNSGYHRAGKPTWWARIGSGSEVRWVSIPRVRGDEYLDCVVDLPPGTTVAIGCGRGRDAIRETVTTTAIEA